MVNEEVKKALFIINKHSGTGFQPQIEDRILDTCRKHKIKCTLEFTQGRGHAITLARDAANKGLHYVVAVGGDGTINEVARGLLHSQTTLGIIPRGSGNGLARHLGISVNIKDAIDDLFNGKILRIDTLTMNDKLSLNVSGIGFDGHVANLFANKRIRGLFGYVKLTLKEFFRFSEFKTDITIAGSTFSRSAFIIAIANSSQYGNNARIAPSASVCDGLLHINIVKKVPIFRLDFIYSFLIGTIEKSKFCEILTTKALIVKSSELVPFHVDGEPGGLANTFAMQINPASLLVLVPHTSFQDKT